MSVTSRPHSKPPPPGLHTVELLRAASQRLHIGPKQAMDIAEKLYVEVSITLSQNQLLSFFVVVLFSVFFLLWLIYFQGYISYPRTETTQYPPDFELKPILHEISHNPEYQQFAIPLMQEKINVPKYVCACVLFVPTSLCSMSALPCHHVLSTLPFSQVLLLVLLCFSPLPSFPVFFTSLSSLGQVVMLETTLPSLQWRMLKKATSVIHIGRYMTLWWLSFSPQ